MKKIFLFVLIFVSIAFSASLAACSSSKVTATLTPPPKATPVPAKETPTPETTPTDTAIPGISPEQIAARIAEYNTEFRGFYEVNADGQFYAIDQVTGETTFHPEFGFRADTGDLTWTHYSELLGRELTEPVADLRMDYKMDANNKMVYTGAFSIQGCNFDGKQCNPDMVLDPVTGKEVAQAHSIFEVMMLQLEDMKRMSEQDKINAFDFSQEYFTELWKPNKGGSRAVRYLDERGVEHAWTFYIPGGTGRSVSVRANQISVGREGLLRGLPHFIFVGVDNGKMGFVTWEVGVGTENHERREIFIDNDGSKTGITNFNVNNFDEETPFRIDKEWLPEKYQNFPLIDFGS